MRKLICAFLLGSIWTAGTLGNACAQSIEARQIMEATNADRAQRGLGPLKWDPALARAAQKHADLMVGQRTLCTCRAQIEGQIVICQMGIGWVTEWRRLMQ